ncbi:Histone deacetylase hdt1 [Datura stramonium]|uniref:Histone deacetylase hdt1 n=1 Tax=Datura stramonium TaxID=4076 RepID=A0ABS8UTF8_DATST|nr:Histone deacetylase hdt1 [Datura stramonium]
MEFWGAEVKSGQPLSVQPGDDMILHLSQASLGEVKKDKGSEPVCLSVTIDGKKLVLGTLSSDKLPQQQFDLVFSIIFVSLTTFLCDTEEDDEEDEDESDEEIPLTIANNGKPEAKTSAKDSASAKQKVKVAEPSKGAKVNDGDESSDDDLSEDEDDSEMGEDEEGDSDEDQSDESEEETPKKAEPSKKRPADSAAKTPVPDKKTKFATPQKTDGKKGAVHVATPHPSKQAGKTPGNKTPKSGGSIACKTCNRTFGSENALESHSKAKHSAGK